MHDSGWRFKSPANARARLFARFRLAQRRGRELHLIATAAYNLVRSRGRDAGPAARTGRARRLYNAADDATTAWRLSRLTANTALTDTWSLQGNFYVRGFRAEPCGRQPRRHRALQQQRQPAVPRSSLPAGRRISAAEPGDDRVPRPIRHSRSEQQSDPVPARQRQHLQLDPYGTIDRTATQGDHGGASLQATETGQVFDHGNHFVVGGSIDHAARSALWPTARSAIVYPDLTIDINPAIPGTGAIIHTLGGIGYAPLASIRDQHLLRSLRARHLRSCRGLSPRPPARASTSPISPFRIGSAPARSQRQAQTYTRLNPVTGLTYKLTAGLTAYAGYSEANRAPTPLELACSNKAKPCLLENFLVADPPLKQVVARTYEIGLRRNMPTLRRGKLEWQGRAVSHRQHRRYRQSSPAPSAGRGFFQNVPGTPPPGAWKRAFSTSPTSGPPMPVTA